MHTESAFQLTCFIYVLRWRRVLIGLQIKRLLSNETAVHIYCFCTISWVTIA
jgi:hypothetical protein